MTFREYLAKRIDRAGPDALVPIRQGRGFHPRYGWKRQGISITDTRTRTAVAMPPGPEPVTSQRREVTPKAKALTDAGSWRR
jgi:hypothetical protein